MKFMLDSNIFDELAKNTDFVSTLESLINANKIFLYITHIQKQQILNDKIPKEKLTVFHDLLAGLKISELKATGAFFSDEKHDIPLSVFPLTFSNSPSYDIVRGNKKSYNVALDAVIAQTADDNRLDYIVTNDKDFNRNNIPPKINFEEFKNIVKTIGA